MSMLEELLNIISRENLVTPGLLARRLDTSEELVALMLADLEQAGYLRSVADDGTRCAGCGLQQACQSPAPRLWMRTGKGM